MQRRYEYGTIIGSWSCIEKLSRVTIDIFESVLEYSIYSNVEHLAISNNVQYIFFVQTFKWDIDIISVMPSKCKVWERLKVKLFIAVLDIRLS